MAKGLTIKQERFCQKYLECGNASEAYRFAYNVENMKPATIGRKAAEVMANGTITAKLKSLRAKSEDKFEITKNRLLKEAASIALAPISDDVSARDKIAAITTINKMLGYDAPTQSEIKLSNELDKYSDEELTKIANGNNDR